MSKIIFLILLLTGCSLTPALNESHGYTDKELSLADPYIQNITYVDWFELSNICGGYVYGCSFQSGEIYIYSGLTEEGKRRLLNHEKAHIYEYFVLYLAWKDTATHMRWVSVHD